MGHIHIGYDNPNQEDSERIIYAMDAILGLKSVLLDKDDRRKQMYGSAGCFRFKKYGVEYRTLSNFWIIDDERIAWAYNNTLKAIELVNLGLIDNIVDQYGQQISEAINTNNKVLAAELIETIEKIYNTQLIEK